MVTFAQTVLCAAVWRCVRERRLLWLAFASVRLAADEALAFLLIGPQTRSDIAAAVTHGADTGR